MKKRRGKKYTYKQIYRGGDRNRWERKGKMNQKIYKRKIRGRM